MLTHARTRIHPQVTAHHKSEVDEGGSWRSKGGIKAGAGVPETDEMSVFGGSTESTTTSKKAAPRYNHRFTVQVQLC